VKQRSILLSVPLVRALTDPEHPKVEARSVSRDRRRLLSQRRLDGRRRSVLGQQLHLPTLARHPYGEPGAVLWVREPFLVVDGRPAFVADLQEPPPSKKVRPGILMPHRYSRLRLLVTGADEARLQDITEDGAVREGGLLLARQGLKDLRPDMLLRALRLYNKEPEDLSEGQLARVGFALYWDRRPANRRFPWASNPIVVVTRFRLLADGEAQLPDLPHRAAANSASDSAE